MNQKTLVKEQLCWTASPLPRCDQPKPRPATHAHDHRLKHTARPSVFCCVLFRVVDMEFICVLHKFLKLHVMFYTKYISIASIYVSNLTSSQLKKIMDANQGIIRYVFPTSCVLHVFPVRREGSRADAALTPIISSFQSCHST